MRGLHRLRRYRKSGISLVEMVVTLLIFSIMMTMMVGVLSPAAKIFIRIQKLQYAQIILDNTIQELRGMTRDATGQWSSIPDSKARTAPDSHSEKCSACLMPRKYMYAE